MTQRRLPKNRPTHPGEFVREDILREFSLTENDFAKAIGVSPETVHRIVDEAERITADMALRLGRFTKTRPEMWLNLQTAVDLWDACHSPHFEVIRMIEPYGQGAKNIEAMAENKMNHEMNEVHEVLQ